LEKKGARENLNYESLHNSKKLLPPWGWKKVFLGEGGGGKFLLDPQS